MERLPSSVGGADPGVVRTGFRAEGVVQGVGFRPSVLRRAVALGLAGWVGNDGHGVVGAVEGPSDRVGAFLEDLRRRPPAGARPERWSTAAETPEGAAGFEVRTGAATAGSPAGWSVPPDRAPCPACLADLFDPSSRRHGHAFVSCCDCGPRFSILRRAPWDRASTTMAELPMCAACAAEFGDPTDRRFRAETICCPGCGPRLSFDGPGTAADPVTAAVRVLDRGGIVAVKGVGGYQLCVDATSVAAVVRLRRRKHRPAQPLAVMVADLDAARRIARLDGVAAGRAADGAAPIVVVPARGGLCPDVAPGTDLVGVMLPASGLHHLLARAAGRPLVLTSGNRSGEPIAVDDREARTRLDGVADAWLTHDRVIAQRVDDSVERVLAGRPTVLRRARGLVPAAVPLVVAAGGPTLALGAHQRTTVTVAVGGTAWVSAHVGTLGSPLAADVHRAVADDLSAFLGVEPVVVAHDLHPDLAAAAADRAGAALDTVAVQHHHAHLASCLTEAGESGPAVGVVLDGYGFGADGTAWGGELLVGDLVSTRRVGHLRPVPLPGGDAAARSPWRMAAAYLTVLDERAGPHPVADRHPDWAAVCAVARSGAAPSTTSAGRFFDAVAALCGVRDEHLYDAQAAIELEVRARRAGPVEPYPAGVDEDGGTLVLRADRLVAAVAADILGGVPVEVVAARAVEGFAALWHTAVRRVATREGVGLVALTGGVMQNDVLLRSLVSRLEADGLRVLTQRAIPPNDAGISLGQAAVAAARGAGGTAPRGTVGHRERRWR